MTKKRGTRSRLDSVVGRRFWWKGDMARVMATAEGYWMARKTGCAPFVVHEEDAIDSDVRHRVLSPNDIIRRGGTPSPE